MVKKVHPLFIRIAVVCAGALLGAAQVVILRRGLALSGGDETVFGLTLAVWLLSVAFGGALGSCLTRGAEKRGGLSGGASLAVGLIILSIAAGAAPMILPMVAQGMGWIPGTVAGGGGLLLPLMASILCVGLSGGALFSLSCSAILASTGNPVNLTYLLEAAGSFTGGLATTLIFLPNFTGSSLLVIFAAIALGISSFLLFNRNLAILVTLIMLVAGGWLLLRVPSYEATLSSRLRPGQELLKLLETPYGLLEIYDNAGQITIYENGLLLAVSDDPATAEERAHLALAQHPAPKKILWIGGSLGAAVNEAKRHPSLQQLDIVELNPALFDLAGMLDGNEKEKSGEDQRVHEIQSDGRNYLQRCPPTYYDLILLNLPGPRTARLSKFYTVEGFRLARRALAPGGALIFSIESSDDFIGPDLALLLKSLKSTMDEVFSQTAILAGGNAIFIAGDQNSRFALDADSIASRLASRGVEPVYWDQFRLQDRLSPSRTAMLKRALQDAPPARLNRDRRPISFLMQQVLWSKQLSGGWAGIWKSAQSLLPFLSWGLILAVVVAGLLLLLNRRDGLPMAVGGAVFFVGLTGIALEILALIQYQIHFGSGYREVGLLVGLYMFGLAVGSYLTMGIKRRPFNALLGVQVAWLAAPFLLLTLSNDALGSDSPISRFFFMGYLLMLGVIGGMHFPLAMRFFGGQSPARAGGLYALDLVGAVLGAILFGLFALPVMGLEISTLQLTLLNLPPLLLLFRLRASSQQLQSNSKGGRKLSLPRNG
ncbi:MAG TPA: hypothetical protein VF398_07190 [bacterium]